MERDGGDGRKIAITGNGENRLRRQDSVAIARPPRIDGQLAGENSGYALKIASTRKIYVKIQCGFLWISSLTF